MCTWIFVYFVINNSVYIKESSNHTLNGCKHKRVFVTDQRRLFIVPNDSVQSVLYPVDQLLLAVFVFELFPFVILSLVYFIRSITSTLLMSISCFNIYVHQTKPNRGELKTLKIGYTREVNTSDIARKFHIPRTLFQPVCSVKGPPMKRLAMLGTWFK